MTSDKPATANLHDNDSALLKAAATGEGLVQLTPDLMTKIMGDIGERNADIADRYPALVAACPYEMRLAVAAWVFKNIVDHASDPGSFRYLIYNRLGFTADAYLPLYTAGGMTISNEFDLAKDSGATKETMRVPVELDEGMVKAAALHLDEIVDMHGKMPTWKLLEKLWRGLLKATGRHEPAREGEGA